MSCDAAVDLVYTLLRDASVKPSGLTSDQIRLQELLPNEVEELPLVGVYLVEDRPIQQASEGTSSREAVVQVEIRALIESGQDTVSATKALRAWVCRTLLPNLTAQTGIEGAEFGDFKPFGVAGVERLAGALLEFTIPYFFDPEEV